MLKIDRFYDARRELRKVLRRTPLIPAPMFSTDAEVYIKPENLQVTGSFKVRGAYYKIATMTPEEKSRGVIACSAGNHAQGVALAATKNGIKSVICLPECAPKSKIKATERYGGEVCLVPGVYDDAYKMALRLQEEQGYTFIHPFDDTDVIAGQGTIALELEDQLPDLDAIVVPIGGGGLISGIAYTMKAINPRVRIYGVEASGAASMLHSVTVGRIEELSSVSTIADGIAVKKPGRITFDICRRFIDGIVTVTDGEISDAILALMSKHKLVTEGAGAAAVAAVMFGKINLVGKKAVAILSGGNIDLNILAKVIERELDRQK